MDAREPADAPQPVDELIELVGMLDAANPNLDPEERAERIAGVAHELGVELAPELVATLDEGAQRDRERIAAWRSRTPRPPTHLRAEAELQLAAYGHDVPSAPAWLVEAVEDELLEEEERGTLGSWRSHFGTTLLAEAAERREEATRKATAAIRVETRARLAATDAPEVAQLCLALAREARVDVAALHARAWHFELASRECHDWISTQAERFGAAWRQDLSERDHRQWQWNTWVAGIGALRFRRAPCKHTIRQRSVSRPRSRRHAARRASGLRSGQDPGEEDPDHDSGGRGLAPPRRAESACRRSIAEREWRRMAIRGAPCSRSTQSRRPSRCRVRRFDASCNATSCPWSALADSRDIGPKTSTRSAGAAPPRRREPARPPAPAQPHRSMMASDPTDRNAGPGRSHGALPELRFRGFEPDGEWTLRAVFAVVDSAGQAFRAFVRLLSSGSLVDLQASDRDTAGSTGRPEVDELLQARTLEELARARAVAVVADFDRGGRR